MKNLVEKLELKMDEFEADSSWFDASPSDKVVIEAFIKDIRTTLKEEGPED
jgi:hypothetical protein